MKLLDDLRKDIGEDKAFMADEAPTVQVVSTGSLGLDFATGVGGFPRGLPVEIFARESAGKTSLSYYHIAEWQKLGIPCGFINLEGRFDPKWAFEIAGVDPKMLMVAAPDPGTEAIKVLYKMVNSGKLGCVVFDSIGAMLGDKEQDADNSKQVGGQSALVTQMVKQVSIPAYRTGTTVLYLNQVRDIMNSPVGGEESPGGHALKHMAVIRVHLKPAGGAGTKIYDMVHGEKIEVGYRVVAVLKKNKVGAPKTTASYNFYTVKTDGIIGIDRMQEILDMAFRMGVIRQEGSKYFHGSFPDGMIKSKATVIEYLQGNTESYEQVRKELMALSIGGK